MEEVIETKLRTFRLPMDLQRHAEGDEGDKGEGDKGDKGDKGGGKTFTQEELDSHVQSRLPRAEKAAQKTLAKELGFDSVEAMREALKKPEDKKPEDKKTEPVDVDKLLEEKLKEQNAKTFKRLITAEVRVLASELGFADWEDALALADMKDVKEDDKGSITGVKEALEELAKKKPHLVKAKPGSGKFGSDVPNSPEQKKAHLEAIKLQAQSRSNTVVAGAHDPWKKQ